MRRFLGTINRLNPLNMSYLIYQDETDPENRTILSHKGKKLSVKMPMQELLRCWYDWQMRGLYVQDAFRNLTASEREFILTGITPEEWDAMFKEPGQL